MTDRDNQDEPLLVRPYLSGEPAAAASAAPTWPEASPDAAVAAEHTHATVVLPAVVNPPPAPPPRRRPYLLLAALLAVVLIGGAALAASLLRDTSSPSALPADVPFPGLTVTEPPPATTGSTTTAPAAGAPAATTDAPRTEATSSSPAPSPTSTAPAAGAPTSRATPSSPPVELIAPRTDRVGRIHGPGRLCLDLNGAVAVDNNHIQVFECNDTTAQVWTMAADGTLRVLGKCAGAAGDGTVRINACDGRRSAQWVAGADRTLVNAGACLTDPSSGSRSGAGVRLESCTGADRQRWDLP